MNTTILESLVGIPWGQTDCFALAVLAHERLQGKKISFRHSLLWDENNITERSLDIAKYIGEYADSITEPDIGDIGVMNMCCGLHVFTFVDKFHVLHIKRGGKSSITRYNKEMKRRTIAFYRWIDRG